MNMALKLLAGAACIAVVAAAGYWGVGEWRKRQAAAENAALTEKVRAELFSLASAAPGETEKVRTWCRGLTIKLGLDQLSGDVKRYAEELRNSCVALGYE